jgi:hypothetical protein
MRPVRGRLAYWGINFLSMAAERLRDNDIDPGVKETVKLSMAEPMLGSLRKD